MHSRSVMSARVLIAVAALFVPLSVFGQTVVVNPTTLSVSASSGSSVASQNVTISKSGGGALRWSIVNIALRSRAEAVSESFDLGRDIERRFSVLSQIATSYQCREM